MATIPIRDVPGEAVQPSGDELILIDNGIQMQKATINDAVTPKATEIADQKIADLNLGTAAQANVEDFATAAQGELADTAVQPARTITAGDGLTGGGDLSADRTISLNSASIASLAKADTAVQSVVAGANVTIDATDPQNPIISASGGGAASTDFATVADLLADDNDKIGYAGSGADTEVLPGFIITAQGFRYEVAASDATDEHVETAGGVKLYALPLGGVLYDVQFGVPLDGVLGTGDGTIVTAQLQKWASATGAKRKCFTGMSRIDGPVTFPGGTVLEGLDHTCGVTGRAIAGSYTGDALIVIDGIDGLLKLNAVLSSSPSRGDTRLVLNDTSELREGDWVCLYNPTDYSWSSARSTYREGEWVRIEHIESATEVYLMDPLWHGYNAADMDIYVLRSPQSIARNFRVETPAAEGKLGLKIIGSIDPIVDNVNADGLSTYGCIGLERCVGNLRVNGATWQGQDDTSENEYGLVISSCHGGQIHGNFSAMRHGIAFGNSDYVCNVPSRLITVYANSGAAGSAGSIDFGHGCNEGLTLVGGNHSGLSLGGANHRFVNCRFVKGVAWADNGAHGLIASGGEFVLGDFTFDNCEFIGYANPITTGQGGPAPLNFQLNASTTGDCRFIFNDCIFDVEPTVAYPIRIQVTANHSYKPELIIRNPKIRRGDGITQFARLQAVNDAVEFGLVSVTGVEGLGPNVPRVSFTGTLTASRWVFDPQKGTVSVAGNTGASSVNAAVSFPWAYPAGVTPFTQAWMQNASIGGDRCIVIAASVSNTGFTATAMTADGGNFANTNLGTVAWRAEVG